MGRVIALGPGGKAQAPERSDLCRAVIEAVTASGALGRKLLSPVCKTRDEADDLRRALYRSCRYYCSCGEKLCTRKYSNIKGCPDGGTRIGVRADVVKDDEGRFRVQFIMRDKRDAIEHVIRTYGPDPNDWPYYSRRKRAKKE